MWAPAPEQTERASRGERAAIASGIGFVVLLIGSAAIVPEEPGLQTPPAQLAEWFAAHRDAFLAQSYLRALTAFVMVVFIGGVIGVVRRARGRTDTLDLLAFGGALAFALVMFVSNIAGAAAATLAGHDGGTSTIRALDWLGKTMRYFNGISAALMVGAASAALLQARAVTKPVGWFGLVAVPIFLIGSAGFPGTQLEFLNAIAFPLVPLWPLVLSIALLIHTRTPRPATKRLLATAS
jgi:hypothetical protein